MKTATASLPAGLSRNRLLLRQARSQPRDYVFQPLAAGVSLRFRQPHAHLSSIRSGVHMLNHKATAGLILLALSALVLTASARLKNQAPNRTGASAQEPADAEKVKNR